jgi:hypothetical protein
MPGLMIAPPTAGEGIDTCVDQCRLLIGNSVTNQQAFFGAVHYAALYTNAFTEAQIENNAAHLSDDDDGPRP